MAMHSNHSITASYLEGINAFAEIERECIHAAFLASPHMHMLIPRFDMLYAQGIGEMRFYDENVNYVAIYFSRRGVRQG
jgi:hypothetical protein